MNNQGCRLECFFMESPHAVAKIHNGALELWKLNREGLATPCHYLERNFIAKVQNSSYKTDC